MSMPAVTVLMAVKNGRPYLQTAIESTLAQTYGDFEFLIIDDASTDDTADIIRSYQDPRIRLRTLSKNVGQTAALNLGLQEIKTPWIARMDADDYCHPRRFEAQMNAIKADATLGCVGTFAWFFTEDPAQRDQIVSRPVDHASIRKTLLWSSPIVHSTTFLKTNPLREVGGYDERYRYSADLDLYDRLITKCHAANVPEPLLGLRRHPGQDSHSVKAIKESIQIFQRRLASGAYSTADATVVSAAISLHEAFYAKIESRYGDVLKEVLRAFWLSPSITLGHFLPRRSGSHE
jgi:glycosyltransferase involved in cell wall biosynthesis